MQWCIIMVSFLALEGVLLVEFSAKASMSRMLRHDPVIVISCTRHLMQGQRRQPKFKGAKYAVRIYLYGENYNPME